MTLRTPRPHQVNRRDEEQYQPRELTPHRGTIGTPLVAGIGALVLVLALFIALVARGRAEGESPASALSASPAPLRETVVVTPTLQPTPACVSAQSQLAEISGLTERGDWQGAAREADAALTIDGLCESDRRQLTEKAVSAGLNALYNQTFEPLDAPSHQQEVDRYLALREQARLAGVAFPSALQVARTSFAISQFRLTVAAVELAEREGKYNPSIDRETTRLYISALYGLGYWYTQDRTRGTLYTDGLAYLSASHQLAVTLKTGQGEAAMLLAQLVGGDETRWPAPYRSPLFRH